MVLSKCIQPASTVSSAGIVIATCNGNTLQKWVFRPSKPTVFAIQNQQTDMCLTVPDGSTKSEAVQIIQFPCQAPSAGNAALWTLNLQSKQIFNVGSGFALDVYDGVSNSADGTKIIQFSSHGQVNQLFTFEIGDLFATKY